MLKCLYYKGLSIKYAFIQVFGGLLNEDKSVLYLIFLVEDEKYYITWLTIVSVI